MVVGTSHKSGESMRVEEQTQSSRSLVPSVQHAVFAHGDFGLTLGPPPSSNPSVGTQVRHRLPLCQESHGSRNAFLCSDLVLFKVQHVLNSLVGAPALL